MSLLKIARIGHPVLREPATAVPPDLVGSPTLQRLIDDMIETMRESDGVGLAGPQVYASHRILIAEVAVASPRSPLVPLTVLVNPTIVSHSGDTVDGWEGCLSIPDLRGRVPRWRSAHVVAMDREGRPAALDADGFFARILQHEIDHLDGVLFPERMTDLRTLTALREFQRFWADTLQP